MTMSDWSRDTPFSSVSAVSWPRLKPYWGGMAPCPCDVETQSIMDVDVPLYVIDRERWMTRDVTIIDDERPGWRPDPEPLPRWNCGGTGFDDETKEPK